VIDQRGVARAKGAVELVLDVLRIEREFERTDESPFLPGRAARIGAGDHDVGRVGELHPAELPGEWGYAELVLDELAQLQQGPPQYEDVITFPPVKQDLAFIVGEGVVAADLVAAAHEAAGSELRSMRPFDVYRGEQVGEGKKSIAFAVEFQSPERTLSDEDAAALRERIVAALGERFGAVLRA
jgi:phenylalanyl-tRNA synthetase beta chain